MLLAENVKDTGKRFLRDTQFCVLPFYSVHRQQKLWLKNRLESQIVPGTKQTPPPGSRVALNKLVNLFETQFSQLKVRIKKYYRVAFRIK